MFDNWSFLVDTQKNAQQGIKRETEVLHIPFRIPSSSSLLKSDIYTETDLSQTFCEMVLEEETTMCTNDMNGGKFCYTFVERILSYSVTYL